MANDRGSAAGPNRKKLGPARAHMLTMFRLSVFACLAATAAPLTAFRPLSYGGSASRPPSAPFGLSKPYQETPLIDSGVLSLQTISSAQR